MRNNHVREALQSGKVCLGTFVFEFNTTGIGRLAAEAGAEFVLFDMEHSGWGTETIRMLMASTRAAHIVPMVRVPATQYHFMARVLDMGAMGIMCPMVESAEQAQLIVNSCKYPPVGRRGAAFTIAHDDYTAGDVGEKMRSANEQTLLIAQIETATGLEYVEQIAAVPGIDVLWIGQYDLTNSLGIPGQFEHPRFLAAVDKVLAAARTHGKHAGYMPLGVLDAKQRIEQGFRCLSYGGDLWLYQQALSQGLRDVRKLLETTSQR